MERDSEQTCEKACKGARGAALKRVYMPVQGHYIAPRVTNLALQYITTGVALSASWKVMRPHMQSLMANVVFPLCCFDDEDQELWDEDPQEYIRKVGRVFTPR